MRRPPTPVVAWSLIFLAAGSGCFNADPGERVNRAMPPGTGFIVRSVESGGRAHRYSVFVPRDYTPGSLYPAIVFLHGVGEAGDDGKKCTTVGLGPAVARRAAEFPFIVIFPQNGWDWTSKSSERLVLDVLRDARRHYSIDPDRGALTGLSSGGKGTWVLGARHPRLWSALVPMGSYAADDAAPALARERVPVWALHNSGDFIVPVGGTRRMVKQIRAAGGDVRYSEYERVGHNCWDEAYDEGELFAWLQRQRRSARVGH